MLSAEEIDQMTAEEKLQAVDQILSSFGKHNADSPSPDWHGDVLSERMRKIKSGEAKWLSFDEVKKDLMDLS